MTNKKKSIAPKLRCAAALVCMLCAGTVNAEGQASLDAHPQSAELPSAYSRLKKGDFLLRDVQVIVQAGFIEAVPELEKQFSLSRAEDVKGKIAGGLVRLGVKDPKYWDYLVQGAQQALDSDIPSPYHYDLSGKVLPDPPAEVVAWAQAHNVTTEVALQMAIVDLPFKILFLGDSADPRAVPLLRKALEKENVFMQIFAAMQLAAMDDKDSIPFIVEACRRAPVGASSGIASSLETWNDPNAKKAAREFRPGLISE